MVRKFAKENESSFRAGDLTLLLLVAGVLANDPDDIMPPHYLARCAQAFDGSSNFHGFNQGL
jgi:hypothetical protein